jgi:hypothetical protein
VAQQRTNPFAQLSHEQRDMIEDAYKAGLTPEQIGVKLGYDIDDVRFYVENFITPPLSRFERLEQIIDDLDETCASVKMNIDMGRAGAMELQAYQRLMSEYRIATAELDSLKQPEDVVEEIVEKVLNPFLIDLMKVCTEETSKLAEEMMKLQVNARDAKATSTDVFRRLTNSVQRTLESAVTNLNNYHGVKKKKQKDAPFGGDRTLQ